MSSNAVNFGRWVRRLVFDRGDEPEIAYNVQPVLVVGNHENLTPRFQGPSIFLGGNSGSAANGDHTLMVWRGRSEGGFLIHQMHISAPGSAVFGIETDEPNWGALGPVEMDVDMIGQPGTVSTGAMGTVAPLNRQLIPIEIYPYVTLFPLDLRAHPVYVPNGRRFLVETIFPDQALSGWAQIEELPAAKAL